MDELMINDKKYISSKQAAKLTGYAKDYVGQLCREGRVPARLVGRSWYVLESAIQDHRFGSPEEQPRVKIQSKKGPPKLDWTREPARYESAPIEPLPPIIGARKSDDAAEEENKEGSENLQNSWKDWFDRVGEHISPNTEPEQEREPELESEPESIEAPEEVLTEIAEDTEVNIPIHAIYHGPPREILPQYSAEKVVEETVKNEERPITRGRGGKSGLFVKLIMIPVTVIALFLVSAAAIGSGCFDKFISSNNYLEIISGIQVYYR